MGGALPGSPGVGSPRLGQLDKLVDENAGSFVVKDGKLESSVGMSFRSGLRRTFGMEKSTEDVTANKEALLFVLSHVRESLGVLAGSYGDSVYARVLQGQTRLPGDSKPITVAERFARGTYVSSELIKQISSIARQELQAMQVEERQRAQNFERYSPVNKAVVQQFFGHEPDLDDVGLLDTAKIKLSQLATKLIGDTRPGFMQAIEELVRDGTDEYPPEMKPVWDAFEGFWLRGENEAPGVRDKILAQLERRVRAAAAKAAAEGKPIDFEMLKSEMKRFLTGPLYFSQFVDLANKKMIDSLTTDDIAEAVRLWGQIHKDDPEVSQQDCDWLAYELEVATELNREQPGDDAAEEAVQLLRGKPRPLRHRREGTAGNAGQPRQDHGAARPQRP
jgi:hypothetical protein